MDPPEGAGSQRANQVDFDPWVRLEFRGTQLSSDGGRLVIRELDDAPGLSGLASSALCDSRRGKNTLHRFDGLFRQSVYGRLAGYEDVNDAGRLALEPVMRVTAIHAQTERKRQDRSVRHAEKRRCRARMTRLCGPIHPHPSVPVTADQAWSANHLINRQNQATLQSTGKPLGECRVRRTQSVLSDHTKAIIKSTAPVLQKHGKEITARMYQIAFTERPEYKRFFENTWMKHPLDGGPQPARLAEAVCAYAQNIDNLGALNGPLEHIAHKHTNTRVIAEQYPVIGACLLQAIKDVLGDAATPEVMTAWGEAYNFLADVLIKREKEIYREEDAQMIAAARN